MNSDLHLFDQLFEEGNEASFQLAPSLPSLQELFADWLDLFLQAWKLPTHAAARWEELRGLYSLTERISLQYCRSDQLERELRQLGVFDERGVKRLTDGLQVFLKIVRSSELQPIRLCTLEMLELWWQALPEAFAWDQLKLMRSWGLDVAWRKEAWRVWWRFEQGKQTVPEHPRQWVSLCQQVALKRGCQIIKVEEQVARWAGVHLRQEGPCQTSPNCATCRIRGHCRWAQEEKAPRDVELAWQAQDFQGVSTQQLIEALIPTLNLPEEPGQAKEGSLLRRVEGWSVQQWQQQSENAFRETHLLLELCRRHGEERLQPGETFHNSGDLFRHFRHRLRLLKQEVFLVVLLDNKHRYLGEQLITQGLLNRSLVHPREVFAQAVEQRAAALVCLHNHPSGDPQPSSEDHKVTQRLKESGQLLGIPLLDHLVIGEERYVSFADEGWL